MTDTELYAEMLKPSETFHDLRIPNASEREIGLLKVELLQCVGLPALDFASETDAVGYMVCGSYAFSSDVIWNRLNPMWLPRSRRACIFPVFHAYAKLYVGIFDDDGKGGKDDFAGRVVLNVSQLRPRSTYDVTLPLRLSGHVYTRRQRGAVRLRLSIDYYSDRAALLSYIPRSIPKPSLHRPDDDTTVICADEKAFRNIVTTVHGIDMPGRFSFRKWGSLMREVNFIRKVVIKGITLEATDIVCWKNPAVSGLLFVAWMHAVYQNTFAFVPLYNATFLLLMMIRSYVFYGSDGPVQNGFIPPSWEEMFGLLWDRSGSTRIKPLRVMPKKHGRRGRKVRDFILDDPHPETHKQRAKWLFQLLGFQNRRSGAHPEHYHMEFPYSQGFKDPITQDVHYTKFAVAEALVRKASVLGKKKHSPDDDDRLYGDILASGSKESLDEESGAGTSLGNESTESEMGTRRLPSSRKFRSKSISSASRTLSTSHDTKSITPEKSLRRRSFPKFGLSRRKRNASLPSNDKEKAKGGLTRSWSSSFNENIALYDLPPHLLFPEQNMDSKNTTGRKKKLGEEMMEVKENTHRLTLHLFHDRTHLVRRNDATYFGQGKTQRSKPIETELQRLLNVEQFSSANPAISRVGLYMEPIISASLSFLSVARLLYNVITWRDPFLSFWFTQALIALVLTLAIFPWRICFFMIGCLLLGPQNWILRIMKERGTTLKLIEEYFERRRVQQLKRKKDKEMEKASANIPSNQPIVGSHTSDNKPPRVYTIGEVDPRNLHEVSVPYSQVTSPRMYDWPPESQHGKCEPAVEMERAVLDHLHMSCS